MSVYASAGVITSRSLPSQMVTLKQKQQDKWIKANLDRLDKIAYSQLLDNMRLLENYRMVKGEFIFDHYFDTDQYSDMITNLTKEFSLPKFLKHYDIISPIVNTLSGEMQEHPDHFKVRRYDEQFSSIFLREKTRLLMKFMMEEINTEIEMQLAEQGYNTDMEMMDFESEEEQQAYIEEISSKRQELTPPEIEKYMVTTWADVTEMYGQHRMDNDKEHFHQKDMDKIEFEDLAISARCFRHFFLVPGSYMEESLNTILAFYHKSPEIRNVEDGDFAGAQYYFSGPAVVARYGHRMTEREIKLFDYDDPAGTQKDNGYSPQGVAYGSVMPWGQYPDYKMAVDNLGFDPHFPFAPLPDDFWSSPHQSNGKFLLHTQGLYRCVETYWRSKRRKGYYCYFEPELGVIANVIVDETFIPPPGTKVYTDEVWSIMKAVPGTLIWTQEDVIYEGVKICSAGSKLDEDVYLGGEPSELQLEHEDYPSVKKLPIISCFLNARNTEPVSIVDLVKPDQIGHNIAMNQGTQLMEREIGRFLVMDVNMLPRFKDWLGEDGYIKFAETARALGVTIADTSPANMKGSNSGGQLPKMLDLDETARILSRFKIADIFETFAKRRVGLSEQRMGDIGRGETATGVSQSIAKSYTQTRSIFTAFFEYKRRYLKAQLDTAIHVDSKKKDVVLNYMKSDLTRAFFQMPGNELSGVKLGLFITDSQETVRQMDLMRQLFMNNNNTDITSFDLANLVTATSPAEVKTFLKHSDAQKEQREAQAAQTQQMQIQMAQQAQQEQLKWEKEKFYADLESQERQEFIRTFTRQPNNMADTNANKVPDMLEYDKFMSQLNDSQQKNQIAKEKNQIAREKVEADKQVATTQARLKEKEINTNLKIARENKNKYDSKAKPRTTTRKKKKSS